MLSMPCPIMVVGGPVRMNMRVAIVSVLKRGDRAVMALMIGMHMQRS